MATDPKVEHPVKKTRVDQLRLDPDNPRLSSVDVGRTQDDLVKGLWNEMAVSEVALSIAANGFFEEEPLFVIPQKPLVSDPEKQTYTVVEGNRRFAAVRLLREKELRSKVKATDLPTLSQKEIDNLDRLPVSVYPDKKSLWAYFGFRHVNGPKEWDSISKAAYITQVRREWGIPLEEITRRIGDEHDTAVRFYRGYLLLEQAERMTHFKRQDRVRNRFYFSHLYTAADYQEFRNFLGIDEKSSLRENPVSKRRLPQLYELMVWLFGSKAHGVEPQVQKQNPDLNYLRSVLGNKQALAALRTGITLKRSYEISLGDSRRLQEALVRAKDALQEAKGSVTTGYRGDADTLKLMEGVVELAASILEEMRKKK